MTAILLAAGKGSRMNNRICSKPMCMVAGKQLIRYPIDALLGCGISNIHIIYSDYSIDLLKLRDAYPELVFHYQENVTGSLSSFLFATKICKAPFLLMDGDIVISHEQLKKMMDSLPTKQAADAYIAVIRSSLFPMVACVTVKGDDVVSFDKHGFSEETTGLQHFPGGMVYYWCKDPNPAILDFIKRTGSTRMSAFLCDYIDKTTVKAVGLEQVWDIDTEEEIRQTEVLFRKHQTAGKQVYHAVVVDLDGSLLKTDKTIGCDTRNVFQRIKRRGVKTIIATSRRLQTALSYYQDLSFDGMICCAGAQILCGQQTVALYPMSKQDAIAFLTKAKEIASNLSFSIETTEAFYTSKKYETGEVMNPDFSNVQGDWLRIMIYSPDQALIDQIQSLTIETELQASPLAGGDVLLRSRFTNKLNGMITILRHFGIERKNTLYFGDDIDDLPCMTHSGLSCTFDNAQPLVKEFASVIGPSNDEDGIAKLLEQMEDDLL